MAKTKKAMYSKRKKTLTKRLKEQHRNAKKIEKRIERIERDMWELELDKLKNTGLLQGLTWEFNSNVKLFNCHATGIRSKESNKDNEVVKKIHKWFWKHQDDDRHFDHVTLKRKTVNGYKMLLGLHMTYTSDDDYNDMVVEIFAIDTYETGTGVPTEKTMLKEFVKKWNIEVDIP